MGIREPGLGSDPERWFSGIRRIQHGIERPELGTEG